MYVIRLQLLFTFEYTILTSYHIIWDALINPFAKIAFILLSRTTPYIYYSIYMTFLIIMLPLIIKLKHDKNKRLQRVKINNLRRK